ncbi:MAG: hypothetical protein Ta2D_08870 [Rickettsiales bacterium]|nr:MAG: hypothetical protein Ta2D_08870 [Rickettsiales bacterium]
MKFIHNRNKTYKSVSIGFGKSRAISVGNYKYLKDTPYQQNLELNLK